MKKLKTIFGVMVISSLVILTTPVSAQSGENSVSTSHTTEDRHDDSGKWGLLGLLGLAGLLGLNKKGDQKYSGTDASARNRS